MSWQYELPISAVTSTKLASIAAHRTQLPDGDPEAIFPPGIVRALLDFECFSDATGRAQGRVRKLVKNFAAAARPPGLPPR